jgi:maltose O-acetyltransferase
MTGRKVKLAPGVVIEAEVTFGDLAYVGREALFEGAGRVTVGRLAQIGARALILTTCHPVEAEGRMRRGPARTWTEDVQIGELTWIGAGAILLPGVTVGPRSVIGAGSVVTRDIPADVIAVGNPARVIRRLPTREGDSDGNARTRTEA